MFTTFKSSVFILALPEQGLTIRSEKNLENDKNVIGVLEPGDEFDILSAEGEEWYQINSNGRVGYVNLSQYWNFYSKCLKSVAATARNA